MWKGGNTENIQNIRPTKELLSHISWKLETKHWSIKNADVYLTVNGINSEFREDIIERANNWHKLKETIHHSKPTDK